MDKYQRAQDRIAAGLWTVDAEAGTVHNADGKQIGSRTWSGYTFLSMAPVVRGGSNQNVYAHRVIWEFLHGPIPEGMQINHINGDKGDARIANLEMVTPRENMQHAIRTGLMLPQACGEKAHRAKVTAAQVLDIRRRATGRETQQSIASSVGISRQQVGRIVRGERWRQLSDVD